MEDTDMIHYPNFLKISYPCCLPGCCTCGLEACVLVCKKTEEAAVNNNNIALEKDDMQEIDIEDSVVEK